MGYRELKGDGRVDDERNKEGLIKRGEVERIGDDQVENKRRK